MTYRATSSHGAWSRRLPLEAERDSVRVTASWSGENPEFPGT